MYEDALGAEFETQRVAETPVAGITDETPGTYTLPQVAVEDYVRRPEVSDINIETAITADEAIEQLETYVDIAAPADVTADEITVAAAAVTTAIKKEDINPQDYEAALVETPSRNRTCRRPSTSSHYCAGNT